VDIGRVSWCWTRITQRVERRGLREQAFGVFGVMRSPINFACVRMFDEAERQKGSVRGHLRSGHPAVLRLTVHHISHMCLDAMEDVCATLGFAAAINIDAGFQYVAKSGVVSVFDYRLPEAPEDKERREDEYYRGSEYIGPPIATGR
jgi:hypothetical protein